MRVILRQAVRFCVCFSANRANRNAINDLRWFILIHPSHPLTFSNVMQHIMCTHTRVIRFDLNFGSVFSGVSPQRTEPAIAINTHNCHQSHICGVRAVDQVPRDRSATNRGGHRARATQCNPGPALPSVPARCKLGSRGGYFNYVTHSHTMDESPLFVALS